MAHWFQPVKRLHIARSASWWKQIRLAYGCFICNCTGYKCVLKETVLLVQNDYNVYLTFKNSIYKDNVDLISSAKQPLLNAIIFTSNSLKQGTPQPHHLQIYWHKYIHVSVIISHWNLINLQKISTMLKVLECFQVNWTWFIFP